MKNRFRAGLAGASVLALGGVLVGAPSPAVAAAGDGACTSTETCVFRLVNYDGKFSDVALTDGSWANNAWTTGGSINNDVSSGGNVDRAIRLYTDTSYGGEHFTLGVGVFDHHWTTNQPNATASWYNFNNKVSSSSVYVPVP